MCGLVGGVQFDSANSQIGLNLAEAMRELFKRGPDGGGHFIEAGATLGHRRLAVIDISQAATQPMISRCGRYVIAFNGEMYNFAELRVRIQPDGEWRSNSDTEVVLEAFAKWGPSCLDRFHGMFAIAIWDRQERRLFLARDRLGVKPLFYTHSRGFVGFASRPGPLRALIPSIPSDINRQAVRWYLESGYVPAPLSFFTGIRKLEPGCYLLVDSSGIQRHIYWSLDDVRTDFNTARRNEEELLDELDQLVDRSIRWRMVSSVPVGAFLSGGVDSSLVVSRMAKLSSGRIKTFTIGFSDQNFDESKAAAEIAKIFDTDHYCQRIYPKDLLDLLPNFLMAFDEPFFDHSAIAVMAVSKLASAHVKVALSGDGGDEAFGGYHYYRAMALLERAYRVPRLLRWGGGEILRRFSGRLEMIGEAIRRPTIASSYAYARSVIKSNSSIMQSSLIGETQSFEKMLSDKAEGFVTGLSAAELAMRLDIAFTLPDDYLQKVDVASMAYSIEARDPLLDHSIMEWAARLSQDWKLRGGVNKYLLRRLTYRAVPQKLLDGPKRGFGLPMNDWLRGDLQQWGRTLLDDSTAMANLELDRATVLKLWARHQSRRAHVGGLLWSVLVLIAFYRTHVNGRNNNLVP